MNYAIALTFNSGRQVGYLGSFRLQTRHDVGDAKKFGTAADAVVFAEAKGWGADLFAVVGVVPSALEAADRDARRRLAEAS